jgi:hypothetical protein
MRRAGDNTMKWNAYYFDTLSAAAEPARVIAIEARDEDEAGKIAIAGMGRSMRVHVARPIWAGPSTLDDTKRRRVPAYTS